jgi:uncharacterized protein YkwD
MSRPHSEQHVRNQRESWMRRATFLAALLAFASGGLSWASGDAGFASLEAEVLRLVNVERAGKKLPLLDHDERIADVARSHSKAMASGRRPPGHDGFEERWTKVTTLIGASTAAENVAIIPGDTTTPGEMAVDSWMKSKDHRSNMLDDYRYSGIGIARAQDGKLFMTHLLVGARNTAQLRGSTRFGNE